MAFWKREREGGRRQAAGAGRPAWDLEAGVGGVGPPRLETLALGGVCCPRTGQVSSPASQASAGPACPGSSSQPAKDGSPEPGPWALQPARTPAGARLGVGLQHVGGHPPGPCCAQVLSGRCLSSPWCRAWRVSSTAQSSYDRGYSGGDMPRGCGPGPPPPVHGASPACPRHPWQALPFHCAVATDIQNSLPSAHLKMSPCSPYTGPPPHTHMPGPVGAAPPSAVQPLPLGSLQEPSPVAAKHPLPTVD